MNIISAVLLAFTATSPFCFANSDSDSPPKPETQERYFLRLDEIPFDRTDCEKFILGEEGVKGRQKHVDWLKTWDIPFVPTNRIKQYVRKQDTDPDFAVAIAPPKTPKKELERIYRNALVDAERTTANVGKYSAPAATALSRLHAVALGIEVPTATVSEELETRLLHRGGKMLLRTSDHGRVIGEVELGLDTLQIGYVGNPSFWIYEERKRGEMTEDLEVADFIAQHSVSILRPKGGQYPFVWVLAIHNDPESDELENITLDLHWDYRVHPSVAEDADVQVPPFLGRDEKASKLRFMGLGLTTEIDL